MIALAFLICWIAHIAQGVLLPAFPLLAFAPFLVYCFLKTTFKKTLWLAALAGSFVDLLSDDPMGLHALNYTLVAAALYSLRRRFSSEEPLHFWIYTTLFSGVSTLLQFFLLFLFDRRVPLSGKWALVDLTLMPAADGIYGLIGLFGPLLLLQKLHYLWGLYWLRKKKNPYPTSP